MFHLFSIQFLFIHCFVLFRACFFSFPFFFLHHFDSCSRCSAFSFILSFGFDILGIIHYYICVDVCWLFVYVSSSICPWTLKQVKSFVYFHDAYYFFLLTMSMEFAWVVCELYFRFFCCSFYYFLHRMCEYMSTIFHLGIRIILLHFILLIWYFALSSNPSQNCLNSFTLLCIQIHILNW